MASVDFQARLNRIEKSGPSGIVTPGAVENTGFSRRKYLKAVQPTRKRKRRINCQAVVLAGMAGVTAALMFEKFVGIGGLVSTPVSTHLAAIQADQNIAAAFALIAAGPVLWIVATLLRRRWQAPYQFAMCYMLALALVSSPAIMAAAGVDADAMMNALGFDSQTIADLLPAGAPDLLEVF